MDWPTIIGTVAGILGILSAAGWVGKKLHKSLVHATSEGVTAQLQVQLQPVLAELSHNGGESMKDKLAAIDERTQIQGEQLARLESRVDDLFREGSHR